MKHCSRDEQHVLSIIPGVALNNSDSHAFIQVMEGISGKTGYISYPLETFQWDQRTFEIKVGSSTFSGKGVMLDIDEDSMVLKGRLDYHNPTGYPGTWLSPGIMGWYSFVPFMECYHGIVSANHELSGTVTYNHQEIDFSGGNGYIEKDWGRSFPETWIWVQCNNFHDKNASLFFSVAKIPWLGNFFMGFIAFFYLDGKYHIFSTYNKSRLVNVSMEGDIITIKLVKRSFILSIRVIQKISGELKAPVTGLMSRRIKESNDSIVEVTFADRAGNTIFSETGTRAGLEIAGRIFDYL